MQPQRPYDDHVRGWQIWAVGIVAVVGTAGASVKFPLAVFAVVAVLFAFSVRRHPRIALVLWMISVYFVPYWTVVPAVVTDLAPPTIGALLIAPTIFTYLRTRMILLDWIMLAFVATIGLAVLVRGAAVADLASYLTQWAPAYFVGRVVAPAAGLAWTGKVIAVFTGIIGLWSIAEFLFHWHVFVNYAGTTRFTWQSIQTRGPWERSEAAFGHSIALGVFLAIGIPFILQARFRFAFRAALLLLTAGGVFVTFSRAGQVSVAIAIVLCIVFLREKDTAVSRNRIGWGLVTLAALSAVVPFVLSRFAEVSDDLDPSTAYRGMLLDNLGDIHALGPADFYVFNAELGRWIYRYSYGSIDNTPLLLGLSDGWIPVLILALPLVAAIILLIRGRASVPVIAIIAVLPVLVTASLITQWVAGFPFLLGLAAAYQMDKRNQTKSPSQELPAHLLAPAR